MSGWKGCLTCSYFARDTKTCDYVLITGRRRGCPAGIGCVKYERAVKKKPSLDINFRRLPVKDGAESAADKPKRKSTIEAYKRRAVFRELYNKRLTDREIADEAQCNPETVRIWRRSLGLPSQRERLKMEAVQSNERT